MGRMPENPQALVLLTRPEDEGMRLASDAAQLDNDLLNEIHAFASQDQHQGGAGAVSVLPRPGREPQYVVLAGLGTADSRKTGAAISRVLNERVKIATVLLPVQAESDLIEELALGARLASYRFSLKSEPATPALEELALVESGEPAETRAEALKRAIVVSDRTAFARDLVNTPSNIKSPAWLADQAREAAERDGLQAAIWDEAVLAEQGFGGLLAVGRGSRRPPRLIQVSWEPPRRNAQHIVLVGKGITFDTGGISIKPSSGMELMKKDMGGAAAVLGAVLAAGALKLDIRVTALVAAAENMLGADATRPGDVIRHYGGATTEVLNTDAEGRLVLADALAYAVEKLNPDVLVDLATLTGAQKVALTKRMAALCSDDERLVAQLKSAAESAGEQVWQLPLVQDYLAEYDSAIADRTNLASGGASTITAGLFLREFVGQTRWAHIDMSAPAWSDSPSDELSKGATGWGVRTLTTWLAAAA